MAKPKKKKAQNAVSGNNKAICRHDYKNAIQIGNVDYVCPLCKELLDPLEWFFMNSFEFMDVTPLEEKNCKNICAKKRNI
jgi:hypothetical protein